MFMKYSEQFAFEIITCNQAIDKDVVVLIFSAGGILVYPVFKIRRDGSKIQVVSGYINHGRLNNTGVEITSRGGRRFKFVATFVRNSLHFII